MGFTNFEKKNLGKLFKYYRKKNNVKWQDIRTRQYSSATTYSKIEKGNIIADDEYYYKYLDFYHLSFKRKENFEKWVVHFTKKVVNIFIWNKQEKKDCLLEELENELSEYKSIPIYEQYYKIIICLYNYYFNGIYMNEKQINNCLILLESGIEHIDLASLLFEVIYVSNNNSILENGLGDKIIRIAKQYDQNMILSYIFAISEKCHANFFNAYELFEKSYQYWKKQGNHYREIKNLMGIYVIYKNTDYKKANETSELLIEYLDDEGLPDSLKRSVLYNTSMFYFLDKQYEKAYDLFMKLFNEYKDINVLSYIGSICTHLNIELPNELNAIEYNEGKNKLEIKFYQLKKNNVDVDVLVHYIMNVIVFEELLKIPYVNPCWSMFEYELEMIIKKHRQYYKEYLKYKELMRKTCKDV